jgi:putative flippase GtrA
MQILKKLRDSLFHGHIVRFIFVGGLLTGLVSIIYFILASYFGLHHSISILAATVIASCFGYFFHSAFTFRGYGSRERPADRFARFITTNLFGYSINAFAVYLMIDVNKLPVWSPIIIFTFFTPLISFFFNKYWVFK